MTRPGHGLRGREPSVRAVRRAVAGGLLVGAVLALPGVAASQDAAPAPAPAGGAGGPPPNPVDLVFDREVFTYPAFDRRNPFRPLSGAETGPRFENLVLRGRILDELDPSRSIALIEARLAGGPQGGGGQTYRVRVGDVLGNTRILEIREQQVVVEVEEFGVFEVRTLQLVRTAPRATPPPPGPTPGAGAPGQVGADSASATGADGPAAQPDLVGARPGSDGNPWNHEVIVNGGRS